MGAVQKPIFSVSGLRGVVGRTLFPETVRDYARGFGRLFGPGPIALGRDTRASGVTLVQSAILGLQRAGCEVIDLGVCPTPAVVHFVSQHSGKVKGGVMITASHNPWEWNGMKFISPHGRFLLPEEVTVFGALLARDQVSGDGAEHGGAMPAADSSGINRADGVGAHIAGITRSDIFTGIKAKGYRFAVDTVNGAAGVAGRELLKAFGCEVVPVFCDGGAGEQGFPRGPEPIPEHLSTLCGVIKKEGLDGGFAFDPDGDRLSAVDETGTPLGEEATLALAAQFVLPGRLGDVVVNLSTSRLIEDICARFDCPVVRTKVGEVWVVREIINRGAVLGGEGNGGVILPEVNLTRDGLVACACIIGLMSVTSKTLSRLRQELPEYHIVKKAVPIVNFAADEVICRLRREMGEELIVDSTEGVRVAGVDWWLHIRPSNTEPIIRIVAEAKTPAGAEMVVQTGLKVITEVGEKQGEE